MSGPHEIPMPEIPPPFTMEPRRYGMSVFTRNEADGAIPNGTKIRKCDEDEGGDAHPIGEMGVVIGSLPAPEIDNAMKAKLDVKFWNETHVYFIEWRTTPDLAIGTMGSKIERVEGS
jgi:hypothetical protein